MTSTTPSSDLTIPMAWDHDTAMITDEELSATSHEEAGKVFEQWQADEQEQDGVDIMEVDEQIGSTLLGEDIFPDPCVSPSGPLEEIIYMNFGGEDVDRFSLSLFSDDVADKTSSLSFEERYKATLEKLNASMKRSQETRKSLKMETPKTEDYSRKTSVTGVLTSVEKSTQQLQSYLKTIEA